MPAIRQTNFLGGELDPKLWGRTDLPVFGRGLRTMRNFFASRQGAAVSRPGTVHLATLYGVGQSTRIIPFSVSDQDSFVLVIGPNATLSQVHIRVFKYGIAVDLRPVTAPGTYSIALLGYGSADDLQEIRFAQSGNYLILVTPKLRPAVFIKVSASGEWTVEPVPTAPDSSWFFDIDVPGIVSTDAPALVTPLPTPAADGSRPSREWIWWASVVAQDPETGYLFETKAVRVTRSWDGVTTTSIPALSDNLVVLYPDKPVLLRRPKPTTLANGFPTNWAGRKYRAVAHNYYRGRGDLIGFVGTTKTRDFLDTGALPLYEQQPPLGIDWTTVKTANGDIETFLNPGSVCYFQERRAFGGLFSSDAGKQGRPMTILASATGDYHNFDPHVVPVSGQALDYDLAARRMESIRHLVATNALLAFTQSSVWSVRGQQGSELDFNSVDARVISEIGCTRLAPLVIDQAVLYARVKGTGVRSIVPGNTESGYATADVSGHAQHLFVGPNKGLRDWAYAEDPWGLAWVVRNDGALLSLSYSADGDAAWCRHDTDGVVHAVCSVPESDEDVVYLVVSRVSNGITQPRLERMASRMRKGNTTDDCYVDASTKVVIDPASTAPVINSEGMYVLIGKSVYMTGVGNAAHGPFTVVSGAGVSGQIPFQPGLIPNSGAYAEMHIGLAFTADLESLDVTTADSKLKKKTVTRVGFEVSETAGILVGQDFEHLVETRPHTVETGYNPPVPGTQLLIVTPTRKWDEGGRAVLRQSIPAPVTVVGMVREIDVGN